MTRAVLIACLPWLGLLAVSCLAAWLLMRMNRARFEWRRIARLHADEVGSAQSLSFVLTLPLFVLVLLFIVQIAQLMVATIVVNYSAFAAARSAIVWIPAYVSDVEAENCVMYYTHVGDARLQMFWTGPMPNQNVRDMLSLLDENSPDYRPFEGGAGMVYEIDTDDGPMNGYKVEKIRSAAVLACAAISPVRRMNLTAPPNPARIQGAAWSSIKTAAEQAMTSIAPSLAEGTADSRLSRKLEYANAYTDLWITFFHPDSRHNPPLYKWDEEGFLANLYDGQELGWEDVITVTVRHKLALLPGPGRFLAEASVFNSNTVPEDSTGRTLRENRLGRDPNGYEVYAYPIYASCTLGNLGEKSVKRYVEPL